METYPLKSLSIEEATALQFSLVDEITNVFPGSDILTRGDLGVAKNLNKPVTTSKIEKVLTNFFDTESAMLVRGSGSGAIRLGLYSMLDKNDNLLVHKAPIYPTTKTTIEMLGINIIEADFNHLKDINIAFEENEIDGVLIQISRQQINDKYDAEKVIHEIRKNNKNIPILTDDNYTALKTSKLGTGMGATLSSFSTFKLLGPEGIGCIVGEKEYIERLKKENYSGGSQVQGHEAIDVIRGMINAPVLLAISAKVTTEVVKRLNDDEVEGVSKAYIANSQSKVILVELKKNIAQHVLSEAERLGAAPVPIGSESKYEFVPMFYRVSGTFRQANPNTQRNMIRINPMRAGADTIIRILKQSINLVENTEKNI